MSNLGELMKVKREAAGLSQKALGARSGVSDSSIHNIEIGKTKSPNWELLCKIAVTLQFHPFEILKAAGYITDKDIHPIHLIQGLDRLDEQGLKTTQLFVDFILSQTCSNKNKEGGLQS